MNETPLLQMAITAFVLIQGLMLMLWLQYRKTKNAGIVDVGWGLSFSIAALVYLLLGEGILLRSFLMTIMVFVWSLRLTAHLYTRYRIMGEDPRYIRIKEGWIGHHDLKMLGVFLFQGFLAFLLTAPFLIANLNADPELDGYEIFGFLLWLVGFVGEAHADWTLTKFKKDPTNKKKVCQEGLWRYSRHPNYFFEWIVWLGFFSFNLGHPIGWFGFYCPFLILHLLLNVSGVPLTELQLLHSKGEAYRQYQRRTSYFVPWWPRRD